TYAVRCALKQNCMGVSSCVEIGGDPVKGMNFVDCLELFEADARTDAVIIIGEIGGNDEETAANYISAEMTKPVVAFIAGVSAPPGKRMGHAGALIEGNSGTAQSKIQALQSIGVKIARYPEEIPGLITL
ncbi:succinate--CoA ligase subunit alpha, partial [bacterium]|nr:succinate--CoA ligase subunit alpha [bacterium]